LLEIEQIKTVLKDPTSQVDPLARDWLGNCFAGLHSEEFMVADQLLSEEATALLMNIMNFSHKNFKRLCP
jgi:hypothetical protein